MPYFCQLVLFTEALGKRPTCVLSLRLDTMVGQSTEGIKHRSAAFLADSKGLNFICLKWDFRCPGLQDKRTALTLTAGMDDLWNVFLEARFVYTYACIVKHPGSRSGSGCGHGGWEYGLCVRTVQNSLSQTCVLIAAQLHQHTQPKYQCNTAAHPALQHAVTAAFTAISNHKGKITADTIGC